MPPGVCQPPCSIPPTAEELGGLEETEEGEEEKQGHKAGGEEEEEYDIGSGVETEEEGEAGDGEAGVEEEVDGGAVEERSDQEEVDSSESSGAERDFVFDTEQFQERRAGGEKSSPGSSAAPDRFLGFGELLRQAEQAQTQALAQLHKSREELLTMPNDPARTVENHDDDDDDDDSGGDSSEKDGEGDTEEEEDEEEEEEEEEELDELRDLSDQSGAEAGPEELDQAPPQEKQEGQEEEQVELEAARETANVEGRGKKEQQKVKPPPSSNVGGGDRPSEKNGHRKCPRVTSSSNEEDAADPSATGAAASATDSDNSLGHQTIHETDVAPTLQQQEQGERRQEGRNGEESVPVVVTPAADNTDKDDQEQPQVEEGEAEELCRLPADRTDTAVRGSDGAVAKDESFAGDGVAVVSLEDRDVGWGGGGRCGGMATDGGTHHDQPRDTAAETAAETCEGVDGAKLGVPGDAEPAVNAEAVDPLAGGSASSIENPAAASEANDDTAGDLTSFRGTAAAMECQWRSITLPTPSASSTTNAPRDGVESLDPLVLGEKGLTSSPAAEMEPLESPQDTALLRRKADRDPRGK